jgi:signal transduction histidine kinase
MNAERAGEDGREWLVVTVTDTGIGMSEEQRGRLFQEFSQASADTARNYGGTGLGLAIAKRFCVLMGGDITVTSAPGKGSTFTVRIPAQPEPVAQATPAPDGESAPLPRRHAVI